MIYIDKTSTFLVVDNSAMPCKRYAPKHHKVYIYRELKEKIELDVGAARIYSVGSGISAAAIAGGAPGYTAWQRSLVPPRHKHELVPALVEGAVV